MTPDLSDFLPFAGYEGAPSPVRFVAILVASTLLDAAVLHLVLFGRRRPGGPRVPVDLPRILRAGLVLAGLTLCKVLIHGPLGLSGFGVINLVWHDLVYVLPSCAVRAGFEGRRGRRLAPAARVAALLSLLFLPVAAYARFIEPFSLRIETAEVELPAEREEGAGPLRVAVLADFQCDRVGEHERRAVDCVLELKPDVILLPGDLFHGSTALFDKVKDELSELLSRLHATGGVYFALGDVDRPDRVLPLLDGAGIRVLENEVAEVRVRGWTLTIGGLERDSDTEEARRVIERLETGPGCADVRILLAHHPDVVKRLEPDSRIDLTVAGHTHGGQVAVPFLGPPVTLSTLPRRVAAGGLHEVSGNRLYVSRGVGLERSQAPRIRFLAPPEVSLLLLHRTARPRER